MTSPSTSTSTTAAPPRLALFGITKRYGPVLANQDIDLSVAPGEIHAVLGENGAGKSTLMKIIYGVVKPDSGTIAWDGKAVRIANPAFARKLGIGMVFQQFSLFESLTVAENIALSLPASQGGSALPSRIRDVSSRYGLPLDPHSYVHAMAIGEHQRIEVVRCLLQEPRLMILDEPTSLLTPQAADKLFATLRRIASDGCSILYISHKLDEIRALCHRATVLQAGRVRGCCDPRTTSPQALARLMIGDDPPRPRRRRVPSSSHAALIVRDLTLPRDDENGVALEHINLTVHTGEIVGIAGVSGNGQRELLRALSGERLPPRADTVTISGVDCAMRKAGERRALGLSFVPEERIGHGAVGELSLAHNALLTAHRRGMTRQGVIVDHAVNAFALAVIAECGVVTTGPQARAATLSGGNLQKFIVGREIRQQPKIMIAAQPTAGLDIGAAAAVRQALIDLGDAGAAVLIVSDDLDELLEICDRIAIMVDGRLSATMPVHGANRETIGLMMSGASSDDDEAAREPVATGAGDAHQT